MVVVEIYDVETNARNLRDGPRGKACWDTALGSRSYIDNACPTCCAGCCF
jgi:hypothetical protein